MKKQKGMTLIEIVISIAVYGVLALLVTEIMTTVNATMRATSQLNDRLAFESRFADNNMTKDATGHPFPASNVTYSVDYTYDGTIDFTYNHGTSGMVGDTTRTAIEYRMDYNDPTILGTNYAQNVNYRFMTFDKVAMDPSECPDGAFQIYIRFVPYFSDEVPVSDAEKISKIQTAKRNLADMKKLDVMLMSASKFEGTEDKTIEYTGTPTLGSDWTLDLENSARTVTEDINDVSVQLKFTSEKDMFSDGVSRKWSESDVEVYLYVKVTKDLLSATYYKNCLIEFNATTGEFKPMKSYQLDEVFPAPTDYEAILNPT
ncbi:MAG: prepilin-type N-terminal cleavage/methylation domain-containing protein [Oscillospiraceae bacterium]|nr:prepilin-type N-terminal cleavage/methylation domain-containing protein [Oscillospiraceae bacterium]